MNRFLGKFCFFGVLFLLGIAFIPRGGSAEETDAGMSDRLVRLTALFELSVKADAYLAFCKDQAQIERNIYYVANYGIIQNELIVELKGTKIGTSYKDAKGVVLQRRKLMRRVAGEVLQNRGCSSEYAKKSWMHAKKLTRIPVREMFAYVHSVGR